MRCYFRAYQDQNGRIGIRYAANAEDTEYNELWVTTGQRADLVSIIREIIAEKALESEVDDLMPDEDDLEENISEEATTVIERRPKDMTLKTSRNISSLIQHSQEFQFSRLQRTKILCRKLLLCQRREYHLHKNFHLVVSIYDFDFLRKFQF